MWFDSRISLPIRQNLCASSICPELLDDPVLADGTAATGGQFYRSTASSAIDGESNRSHELPRDSRPKPPPDDSSALFKGLGAVSVGCSLRLGNN